MKNWYPLIGALAGILITYLCGALVAWDLNPGDWSTFWRFVCATCAIVWAIIGASLGAAVAS